MKLLTVLTLILLSSLSFGNGQKGDPFYVKSIKEKVCEMAYKEKTINKTSCMSSRFTFAQDKISLKIEGQKKPLTTLMILSTNVKGIEFQSAVAAKLKVHGDGQITREGWEVRFVFVSKVSDKAVFEKTWYGKNVKKISRSKISKRLQSKLIKESRENVELFSEAGGAKDTEIEVYIDDLKAIVSPNNKKILGYLLETYIASESKDLKEIYTLKFDTKGELRDESVEGFGYHE